MMTLSEILHGITTLALEAERLKAERFDADRKRSHSEQCLLDIQDVIDVECPAASTAAKVREHINTLTRERDAALAGRETMQARYTKILANVMAALDPSLTADQWAIDDVGMAVRAVVEQNNRRLQEIDKLQHERDDARNAAEIRHNELKRISQRLHPSVEHDGPYAFSTLSENIAQALVSLTGRGATRGAALDQLWHTARSFETIVRYIPRASALGEDVEQHSARLELRWYSEDLAWRPFRVLEVGR